MARSFNGTNQRFDLTGTPGPGVTGAPLTFMIDCVPGSVSGGIPVSFLVGSGAGGAWDGYYFGVGSSLINATSASNTTFASSSGVPIFAGIRQLITGVWRSDSSRQCFCNNKADTEDITSKIPVATPDHFVVGAANHRSNIDNFATLTAVYHVYVFPFAITFQQHLAMWRQGIVPSKMGVHYDFGWARGATNDMGNQPPKTELVAASSPGMIPQTRLFFYPPQTRLARSLPKLPIGAGQADGVASVAGAYQPNLAYGLADGFATVQAFPPSHGNADGFANVFGSSILPATAHGNADGFANVFASGGVAATGHADGRADVFSGTRRPTFAAALLMGP